MAWIVIGIVLLVVGMIVAEKGNGEAPLCAGVAIIAIACFVGAICTLVNLNCSHSVNQCDRNIAIAQKQYDDQVAIIRSRVEKYPLEAGLLKNFNPAILLKLPEIKSDQLLVAEIELAVTYRDKMYEWQYEKSSYMKFVEVLSHRWLIPRL